MQAINHMAVALVVKKKVPTAPLIGLLIATEAIEFLWVALNLLGIEYVEFEPPGTHITDVHLAHMPFSHSITSSIAFALILGAIILWRSNSKALAVSSALTVALLSHIVLDLAVHAKDIPLLPLGDSTKFGSGLGFNFPLAALLFETLFGLCCWWYYKGNRKLLAVFLISAILVLPGYLPRSWGVGIAMTEEFFPVFILGQIVTTMVLVWLFARKPMDQS